jgi:hypothetical protein
MSRATQIGPSKIVHVASKQAAIANAITVDVQQLQFESAEIAKTLAAMSPSHPSYGKLQARQTAINVALNQSTTDDK